MARHRGATGSSELLARLREEERGATLAVVVVMTGVLLGAAALAVDLGMLIDARTESQRAADAGALAGATVLADPAGTAQQARERAKEYAKKHAVLDEPVDVNDGDADVIMSEDEVRVRVRHELPTIFARIFGRDSVDVATVAAARAAPAGGASCPLPIAAIDDWTDTDGDDVYDPGEPYRRCTGSGSCAGYQLDGHGELIDPTSPSGGGSDVQANTANVAAAFMEKVAAGPNRSHRGGPRGQWNFYIRLLQDAASGTGMGESEGTLLRRIVLVE